MPFQVSAVNGSKRPAWRSSVTREITYNCLTSKMAVSDHLAAPVIRHCALLFAPVSDVPSLSLSRSLVLLLASSLLGLHLVLSQTSISHGRYRTEQRSDCRSRQLCGRREMNNYHKCDTLIHARWISQRELCDKIPCVTIIAGSQSRWMSVCVSWNPSWATESVRHTTSKASRRVSIPMGLPFSSARPSEAILLGRTTMSLDRLTSHRKGREDIARRYASMSDPGNGSRYSYPNRSIKRT